MIKQSWWMAVALAALLAVAGGAERARAQSGPIGLTLQIENVSTGQTGTATARFNRRLLPCGAGGSAPLCTDPVTGQPIVFNEGSVLNGNVVFTISDASVATWDAAQPNPQAGPPSATAGFVATANQIVRRCGFFPTTGLPGVGTPAAPGPIAGYFGGCESVSAVYRALRPGVTQITVTFIPDLPGAFSSRAGFPANAGVLLALFAGYPNPTDVKTLEVTGPAPAGDVQLVAGCNNVTPAVTEVAAAFGTRVSPPAALVAVWEHRAATNTFVGFSPLPGAPSDLPGVTRLRPVFVCVTAAAALTQPPV